MGNVVLVGESNPFGGDDGYALWPDPPECAGGRLMRILGMSRDDYLRTRRVNLLRGARWRAQLAREAAGKLLSENFRVYVLLGRRVAAAFALGAVAPFSVRQSLGLTFVLLPHPSGRCRAWSDTTAQSRARALLRPYLPIGGGGEGVGAMKRSPFR